MRITGTEPPLAASAGAPLVMALDDRFHRNVLFGQPLGDGGRGARLVARQQPDVIAALMALHRRLAHRGKLRRWAGRTARCAPRAPRRRCRTSTAEAVAAPPAPGPTSVSGLMPSASMVTALVTPITWAMARILAHHGRVHALLDALRRLHRHAQQLDAIAELVGGGEVGRRDRGNALHIDRALDRPWCRRRGSPASRASARCRGPRCRRSDRPRHSPAAARPSGTRRRTASPAPSGSGCNCRCR